MNKPIAALVAAAALGLAACTTVTSSAPPPVTKTVRQGTSSPPATPPASPPGPPSAPGAPAGPGSGSPNVTDPWAVVSAYYGDIESGNYRQAWVLLSSGAVTGQTYQQFVGGFACTGSQQLSELGESGNQVRFDLAATDSCSGAVQHFTGTDTVSGGKIVAARVTRTG